MRLTELAAGVSAGRGPAKTEAAFAGRLTPALPLRAAGSRRRRTSRCARGACGSVQISPTAGSPTCWNWARIGLVLTPSRLTISTRAPSAGVSGETSSASFCGVGPASQAFSGGPSWPKIVAAVVGGGLNSSRWSIATAVSGAADHGLGLGPADDHLGEFAPAAHPLQRHREADAVDQGRRCPRPPAPAPPPGRGRRARRSAPAAGPSAAARRPPGPRPAR